MYTGSLREVVNEGVISGIKGFGVGAYRGAKAAAKETYRGYTEPVGDWTPNKKRKAKGVLASIPKAIAGAAKGAFRGAKGGWNDDYETPIQGLQKEYIDRANDRIKDRKAALKARR